jgi:hypothetical protein
VDYYCARAIPLSFACAVRHRVVMIDDDLRLRAGRLLTGQHRVEDLDRLFLGQRDRHHGKESFREIGDFVAHRAERQKGLVTQVARDVFTSVSIWSLGFRDKKPSKSDIVRAAQANYRLALDQQLKNGCGLIDLAPWQNSSKRDGAANGLLRSCIKTTNW